MMWLVFWRRLLGPGRCTATHPHGRCVHRAGHQGWHHTEWRQHDPAGWFGRFRDYWK